MGNAFGEGSREASGEIYRGGKVKEALREQGLLRCIMHLK
jgi:hypothetical protein